jgi:hypothetical protein
MQLKHTRLCQAVQKTTSCTVEGSTITAQNLMCCSCTAVATEAPCNTYTRTCAAANHSSASCCAHIPSCCRSRTKQIDCKVPHLQ